MWTREESRCRVRVVRVASSRTGHGSKDLSEVFQDSLWLQSGGWTVAGDRYQQRELLGGLPSTWV